MPGYRIPAETARVEYEVKWSRFIGIASRTESAEEARRRLEDIRKEFPDATHHCWAYLIGNPSSSTEMRMDDDGEPTGTAGKPILQVLRNRDVGDVLVVVVRYFGGIKLGAGGLLRAYSTTASKVIEVLTTKEKSESFEASIVIDYEHEAPVRRSLTSLGATILAAEHAERVTLRIRSALADEDSVRARVANATGGRAEWVASTGSTEDGL